MMQNRLEIHVRLSPIQRAFVEGSDVIQILIGGQGEGKTFAGAWGMWRHAQRWFAATRQPLRGLIVRDTFENLRRHTKPSIDKALQLLVQWRRDCHELILADGTGVFDCVGIDDAGALNRIQGGEYAFAWLEEPAPMVESGASAGMSVDVFNAVISRVARQLTRDLRARGAWPRLQVTMNPSDEEHWTYQEFVAKPRFPSHEYPDLTIRVHNLPYGDNVHLSDIARQAAKAAFVRDEAQFARYVEGRFAYISVGERVAPEYHEEYHRTKQRLDPIPGVPAIRGWDGGLSPACVICQISPAGRLYVLDSFCGRNMGVRELIDQIMPVIRTRYAEVPSFRDIGDPAMLSREQSSSEVCAAAVIEKAFGTRFEPGAQRWETRRTALHDALNRMVGGVPFVAISPHEQHLHRALRGGWHYTRDASGRVRNDLPVKDEHSHIGDAFTYVLTCLLPVVDRKPDRTHSTGRRHVVAGIV